jgi:hypothetical protein
MTADARFCGSCGTARTLPAPTYASGQGYGPPPSFPPAGSPPPYGQQFGQPYGAPAYAPQRTNGLAIASFVLSLFFFVCGIGSILAVIFGHIARKQIRERGEQGGGLATAGLIIGYIGIGIMALYLVSALVMSTTSSTGT